MTPTEFLYFDAHTHVQFAAYDADRDAVIRRVLDAGVAMVNVGSQRDTSARAVELTRRYPGGVWAAVGLHPIHTVKTYHDAEELGGGSAAKAFVSRGEMFDYDFYKGLARDPKVVAIGECGLDYYHLERSADREAQIAKQKEIFEEQIRLSREIKKPLMIHCRSAFSDLIEMLYASRYALCDLPGIVHFFSGTVDDAKELLDMGFYFTFGGVITFTRDYDGVIEMIPLDRILSETDAPYVAPTPYRGKRNEPAYVVEVVRKLAELKDTPVEAMAEQILENSCKVFGIKI